MFGAAKGALTRAAASTQALGFGNSSIKICVEESRRKGSLVEALMKAIVCTRYGSPEVLQFKEVKKLTPKNNEVLIKIYATAATASDSLMRRSDLRERN